MKLSILYKQLPKALGYSLISTGVLLAANGSHAATQNEISQVPPSVAEGVPPNMIFTLDESGSMSWAFVPDMATGTSSVYYNKIGGGSSYNTRRMRAATTNPMAYNPHVIYSIPPTFNTDGAEITLSTSFDNAPLNGFWLASDWTYTHGDIKKDLRSDYRLAWEHRQGAPGNTTNGGSLTWAPHPSDFSRKTFSGISEYITYSFGPDESNPIRYEITKTASRSCSAKAFMGPPGNQITLTPSCSLSRSGTATVGSSSGYTSTGVPAYYYEFEPSYKTSSNAAAGSCAATRNDFTQLENCYRLVWVDETSAYDKNGNRLKHPNGELVDGKKNFAIWYSFYRSRALATLSAAKIAFYSLSPDVRFTWQNLKTCSFKELSASERRVGGSRNYTQLSVCNDSGIKPYSKEHKGEFYTWLRKVYFNVGTPLPDAMIRAGTLLTKDEPWEKNPGGSGNTDKNTYSCRPSYHVMMTDGMWNENPSTTPSEFRSDHSTFNTPGGKENKGKYEPHNYSGEKPYYDAAGNITLADLAMHYWATDLNKNLDNEIPPFIPYKNSDKNKEYWDPRNNPAEWQSMSNFIMALGLTTSLGAGVNSHLPWNGTTHSGEGYEKLVSGTAWPRARNQEDQPAAEKSNNVYDLWHAAINSRGEFYSVDSPDAMVQAFQDILTRIADRKSSAAMPGTSSMMEASAENDETSNRLVSLYYQTKFDSADGWTGDLTKTQRYREWNDTTKQYEWITENLWSAKEKLPAHGSRAIFMANSNGVGLQKFNASNIDSSANYNGKNLSKHLEINPDPGKQSAEYTPEERLNYIRGDATNEGNADANMRTRSSKLGDFFGSQPAVVENKGRYLESVANKLEGNGAYTTFLSSIATRKPMVYVGGNAGMLHGFNAATGVEEFAFVPTAVFPYLNKLTGKNYTHQYYVDGSPTIADVYDGQNWRTILVGTLRAGGKGIFALDITDPDEIDLLWEFHEYSSEADDLGVKPGYSFSKPTIARLHNGRWGVVTGNGYKGKDTSNGGAALYVIDAITGELTKSLEVTGATGENGLSTPRLADFDGDGVADYAYAGDLQGNLWRFDLLGQSASGSTSSASGAYGTKNDGVGKFQVSYDGKPMFTAKASDGAVQPITSAPSLVRHPTRKGYLVVFGTGRYVEIGDKEPNKNHAQSLYGIWDTETKGESTVGKTPPAISRTNMTKQTFGTTEVQGTGFTTGVTRDARTISSDKVEWYSDYDSSNSIKQRGWYLDFNAGGLQGEIMIEDMRTLGNTLFLQTLVPNDDPCANGATNWLYAINPFTGGQTLHHAFDTRGAHNLIISGIKFGTEGGVSIGQDEEGYKAFAPGDQEPISPDPSSLGRQTWRMIPDP